MKKYVKATIVRLCFGKGTAQGCAIAVDVWPDHMVQVAKRQHIKPKELAVETRVTLQVSCTPDVNTLESVITETQTLRVLPECVPNMPGEMNGTEASSRKMKR